MEVYVFKTDIKTKKMVKSIKSIFSDNPKIIDWSVDTLDPDKVLRIVTTTYLSEPEIIALINGHGYQCEALPD